MHFGSSLSSSHGHDWRWGSSCEHQTPWYAHYYMWHLTREGSSLTWHWRSQAAKNKASFYIRIHFWMNYVGGYTALWGERIWWRFSFSVLLHMFYAVPVFPETKLVPNYLWHIAEPLSRQPCCQESNPRVENEGEAAPTQVFDLLTQLTVGVR